MTELWGITGSGNIYFLTTEERQWHRIESQGGLVPGFKKVSACSHSLWGLSCDQQLYVYVFPSDVPIRCQEETYENERWVVTQGWSSHHLLPIDPYSWSSKDGTLPLPQDDVKLPSDQWQWEEEWYIDENVEGHMADKGGWRYSQFNFAGHFSHQRGYTSCVRRRKWIRHRRYNAMGHWAKISSLHLDPLEEPVMDVVAGGHHMPNQPRGYASIWIVTVNGRLLLRVGVTAMCPEGTSWLDVVLPDGQEALAVGAGPTGLVWVVTWSGSMLVRTGVSWQNTKGSGWEVVEAPAEGERMEKVAVGVNAVWLTSSRGKLWFRKNVNGQDATIETADAVGKGWLEMVNNLAMVTIGPNDQVWCVDADDHQVYFRTGVTSDERGGRTWRSINLPLNPEISVQILPQPTASSYAVSSQSLIPKSATFPSMSNQVTFAHTLSEEALSLVDVKGQSLPDGHTVCEPESKLQAEHSSSGISGNDPGTRVSGQVDYVWNVDLKSTGDNSLESCAIKPKPPIHRRDVKILGGLKKVLPHKLISQPKDFIDKMVKWNHNSSSDVSVSFKVNEDKSAGNNTRLEFNSSNKSDSLSTPATSIRTDISSSPSNTASQFDPTIAGRVSDAGVDEESLQSESTQSDDTSLSEDLTAVTELPTSISDEARDIQWLWVSAANCIVHNENQIRNWFLPTTAMNSMTMSYILHADFRSWRPAILSRLNERNNVQYRPYNTYKLAIEKSSWTKKGLMKWKQEGHNKWLSCQAELTLDRDDMDVPLSSFCIQYEHHGQQKFLQTDLSQVVCVCPFHDPATSNVFTVYTSDQLKSSPRLPPYKLSMQQEEDMNDWVASLTVACCEQHGLSGPPSSTSLWAVADNGDVFLHEPDTEARKPDASEMYWHLVGGHMQKVESCGAGVTWGLGYDGRVWLHTGGYGGGLFKGVNSSPGSIHSQSDTRSLYVYENQRWRLGRGFTDRVFWVDHYMWSDETGKQERSKDGTKLPSRHAQWVSDWLVDCNVSGGTDKDGWQYARHFNTKFHSRPRLRCYLRRRRWIRKYKISTTGPWKEVGPLTLTDISLQTDCESNYASAGSVSPPAVWGIGTNGDVLCRVGITSINNKGQAWTHVATDLPFTSVSIGGNLCVWCTAKDGSAWYRAGVSKINPTGSCWFHIPPPHGVHFTQIAAGGSQVYVLDAKKQLYWREGVTERRQDGDRWTRVAVNVTQVSVTMDDQVWSVKNSVQTRGGISDGVVAHNICFAPNDARQAKWQNSIGGGWCYVSARAFQMTSPTDTHIPREALLC